MVKVSESEVEDARLLPHRRHRSHRTRPRQGVDPCLLFGLAGDVGDFGGQHFEPPRLPHDELVGYLTHVHHLHDYGAKPWL